jgi:hypothetical protein
VPIDLRHHYFKPRIIQSLRAKSLSQARYVSQKLAFRADDYWINLRPREVEIPAAFLLCSIPSQNLNSLLPTIDDALELYLGGKGEHKKNTFLLITKEQLLI